MKQTLTKDMFRFQINQIRPDNFSYEGQGALFDYLEMCEEGSDSEIEFDPIAICCDFSQCSLEEFENAYPDSCIGATTQEEQKQAIQAFLEEVGIWFEFVEDSKEVIFQNI